MTATHAVLLRDWTWIHSHGPALTVALALLAIAAVWRAGRRGSWARVLRGVAIPLVLLWEAQGLFLLALKVHVPRDMAYVLAGVTSAVVLTFAAYADEHFKRHGNLGPAGRWMWYVAAPMGLVVAANSRTPAEAGLRILLPLLSVAAFVAAYVPDEPDRRRQSQGSWRFTPRRVAVACGLIDPADTDLISVHAERRIRQLTAHASGYHRGARVLRRWHGWRFERLTLMADDAMVAESARRVRRVHTGLAATAPETLPRTAPTGVLESEPETPSRARPAARPEARSGPALKLAASKSRNMTASELEPHVRAMLDEYGTVSQARVKRDLHVSTEKAAEALRLAKRHRTVVAFGGR
jgi:hypothetical protein